MEDATLHVHPRGVLYYASAPSLEDSVGRLLHEHQAATRLVVHLDGLGRIDLTGALALRNLLIDAREAGLDVRVVDVPLQAAKTVERTLVEVVPVTMLDEREGLTPRPPTALTAACCSSGWGVRPDAPSPASRWGASL